MDKVEVGDPLYRYTDGFRKETDFLGIVKYSDPLLNIYYVSKLTPKGCWYKDRYGSFTFNEKTNKLELKRKWVSLSARIRFAYPTKRQAMHSYRIRKNKQVGHLKRMLKQAEYYREFATNWEEENAM